jgi:hypothetical protein
MNEYQGKMQKSPLATPGCRPSSESRTAGICYLACVPLHANKKPLRAVDACGEALSGLPAGRLSGRSVFEAVKMQRTEATNDRECRVALA